MTGESSVGKSTCAAFLSMCLSISSATLLDIVFKGNPDDNLTHLGVSSVVGDSEPEFLDIMIDLS